MYKLCTHFRTHGKVFFSSLVAAGILKSLNFYISTLTHISMPTLLLLSSNLYALAAKARMHSAE